MDIGTHIKKQKTFTNTMKLFYGERENANRPIQILSGSPKNLKRPEIKEDELRETNDFITDTQVSVFILSNNMVNICCDNKVFSHKYLNYLKWEVENGFLLGFKGVTINTGKKLKLDSNVAIDNMYKNLVQILEYTNESCPLILKTSSGEKTGTLHDYLELSKFYARFTIEQKKKLKICIDTCRVFVAGYNPKEFINNWINEYPNSLKLVIYNDSKENFGSKKNKPTFPGMGKIGAFKMLYIQKLCVEYEIPMIME